MQNTEEFSIVQDRLDGAEAIRAFLGLETVHQVYALIRAKAIPVARAGHKTIYASKRALRQHYLDATQPKPKKARAA
jgi:hypothetical protein